MNIRVGLRVQGTYITKLSDSNFAELGNRVISCLGLNEELAKAHLLASK